jgi:C6 transcription factor Pro1
MWWSNNDQRRHQKDNIKMIIKRKRSRVITSSSDTPPGLSHSLTTLLTFSDSIDRTRLASIDPQFSLDFDFNTDTAIAPPLYSQYTPYEVDVKTERQTLVNDGLARRESTISTYSTYCAPPGAILPSFPVEGGEFVEEIYGERRESFSKEALGMNLLDFSHGPAAAPRQVAIELDENDQLLLDHFIEFILPSIFPMNQYGSARTDLIIPALESNKCYLHYCFNSAQHYKATKDIQGEQIVNDIMQHRYAAISMNHSEEYQQILEARLSRIEDSLPDIPWHQHFKAAVFLIQTLELLRLFTDPAQQSSPTPFNMTLTTWIDILGATIHGRAPTFAHTYREKHLSSSNCSLGLRELMGCEDKVMYLISEIACLEALKRDGMDDIQLCYHIHSLGDQIGLTEVGETGLKIPYNANGILNPKQLSKNITAAFRLASRIYLCSLVPGFSPSQASCVGLVSKLASVLEFIPSGPGGFDRSLVWVYLIGGSVSTFSSPFRTLFNDRIMGLGDLAETGSFGRVVCLLREVWSQLDGQTTWSGSEAPYTSWRNVMQMKGWDFL